MDFFLGRLTRDHADIDWLALAEDGQRLADSLIGRGFQDVTTTPPGQIDLVRGKIGHVIGLVQLGQKIEPLVAGGPWAGEPWRDGDVERTRGSDREGQRASHLAAGPD